MKPATTLATFVLLLLALGHLLRALFRLDFTIGSMIVPMWPSFVAILLLATLAYGVHREHRAVAAPRPAIHAPDGGWTRLTDDQKFTQLSNAAGLAAAEDQIIWTIFGTFWAANAILLVALFSTGKLPESPLVGLIVAIVGFSLSVVWHVIQRRALGHLQRFEALVLRLEEQLKLDPQLSLSAWRNVEDYTRYLPGRLKARHLIRWCSTGAAVLWAVGFLAFIA